VKTQSLIGSLQQVERLAKDGIAGKLARMLNAPGRYISSLFFLKYQYPKTRRGVLKKATTFFGAEMTLLLPAAMDIYLAGGKTHHSETALARYMIHFLNEGQTYIDIGAHFGYFTLLAATMVGDKGKVVAFEAAGNTVEILRQNAAEWKNITVAHNAISDRSEKISFYEFPVLYSEYNSMTIAQFENEQWMNENKPQKKEVQAVTLDTYVKEHSLVPDMIKIDVEGAEDKAISGCKELLARYSPSVILEFLSRDRDNRAHHKAKEILNELGYDPFLVQEDGSLIAAGDIDSYLAAKGLDSENVVFIKNGIE
jgi:FkbM family methyltransferase